MTLYDDAALHLPRLPGDVSRAAAATHLGHFLAWALGADLLSERHTRDRAEDLDKVRRGWWSGRDYVLHCCEGRLAAADFNAEGRAFAADYLAPGRYFEDYCAEFVRPGGSPYLTRDTPDQAAAVGALLDRRLSEWRARPAARRSRAAHGLPPEVAPRLATPEVATAAAPRAVSTYPLGAQGARDAKEGRERDARRERQRGHLRGVDRGRRASPGLPPPPPPPPPPGPLPVALAPPAPAVQTSAPPAPTPSGWRSPSRPPRLRTAKSGSQVLGLLFWIGVVFLLLRTCQGPSDKPSPPSRRAPGPARGR